MKLYVTNRTNNQRIYLNMLASTRGDLANLIGSPWFNLEGGQYHVHQVVAESENNSTVAGVVVGGLIGLLGGPFGVILGGTLGGALGNEGDKNETQKVNYFNNSRV